MWRCINCVCSIRIRLKTRRRNWRNKAVWLYHRLTTGESYFLRTCCILPARWLNTTKVNLYTLYADIHVPKFVIQKLVVMCDIICLHVLFGDRTIIIITTAAVLEATVIIIYTSLFTKTVASKEKKEKIHTYIQKYTVQKERKQK